MPSPAPLLHKEKPPTLSGCLLILQLSKLAGMLCAALMDRLKSLHGPGPLFFSCLFVCLLLTK
jgi:hypothetical protein